MWHKSDTVPFIPPLPLSIRSNSPKADLSDYQFRILNRKIRKLTREKPMWEVQLHNPSGPKNMHFGWKTYQRGRHEVPVPSVTNISILRRSSRGWKDSSSNSSISSRLQKGRMRRLGWGRRWGGMWMRISMARDEDSGTKEVERAGEERAYQGWTPIPGGWQCRG